MSWGFIYLRKLEKDQSLVNAVVAMWLKKLRKVTGKDWQVREIQRTVRQCFREPIILFEYYLMVQVGKSRIKYKVLDFYHDGKISCLSPVSCDIILAYMMGVCRDVECSFNARFL